MFTSKANETLETEKTDEEFNLKKWLYTTLPENEINKVLLNILNPNRRYLVLNNCPEILVKVQGCELSLQLIPNPDENAPKIVKDSSITSMIMEGALTITLYDLREFGIIHISLKPQAYSPIQYNSELSLQNIVM